MQERSEDVNNTLWLWHITASRVMHSN